MFRWASVIYEYKQQIFISYRCKYYLIGDLPHLQKLKIVLRVDGADAADDADAGDVNDDDRRHLQ